jgi:hypothetical protein
MGETVFPPGLLRLEIQTGTRGFIVSAWYRIGVRLTAFLGYAPSLADAKAMAASRARAALGQS